MLNSLSLLTMLTDDISAIITGTNLDNLSIKSKRVLYHIIKLIAAKRLALNLDQT
jgi:hypothetical protein